MLRRCTRLFRSVTFNRKQCDIRPLSATARLNAREKESIEDDVIQPEVSPVKRKRGRPRKDEPIPAPAKTDTNSNPSLAKAETSQSKSTARSPKRASKPSKLPPRLVRPSPNHHDLASFQAYADRVGLPKTTAVYTGTLYEYLVAAVLSRLNFTIHRTGRSNDLGIDLVGHFCLPSAAKTMRSRNRAFQELKVLVQCKALKPAPAMVRELEGAYVGAPAGWRGEGVLALLVARKEATKGVRDALQRSRWPMGLVQITAEGEVRQFLWNAVAEDIGLAGLGVTVKYADGTRIPSSEEKEGQNDGKVKGSIALTWLGELWKSADAVK